MVGRASVSSSLSRSSKVLLMSILPPVPTTMAPPADSAGRGSLSSMVMVTSLLRLDLYSVWASSAAFLAMSLSALRTLICSLSSLSA